MTRTALLWNCLILIFPLLLTWTLTQIPPIDDPKLGKSRDFLCWDRSWHDFTVHFHFAKTLHEHEIERPYTSEGQLEIYEHWLHQPPSSVMPSAYFPTFYSILGTFSSMPVPFVFFLWNSLSALIWLKATQHLQQSLSIAKGTAISIAILASSTGYYSIFFGQTGLIFTGLLILLSRPIPVSVIPQTLFTSAAILLLFSKPPGAILGLALLLIQKRFREFAWSLLAPLLLTLLFCIHHGGAQTVIDYTHWIQSYNVITIAPLFSDALTPLFQSNFLGFALEKLPITSSQILPVNQLLIGLMLLLGLFLLYRKRLELETIPAFLGWIYLLFSPHLVLSEDLIAGWIVVQWTHRNKIHWSYGIGWLILLLNTSQVYALVAPSFFYHHPISWLLKVFGFGFWLWTEISITQPSKIQNTGHSFHSK